MIPELSSLAVFVVAALALLIVPGPAVVYIVARSIHQGRRAGLVSVLGIHVGTLVHIGAAKSTLTRRAARAKRASIEISMPGASTPPAYSPAAETTSKFVDVPKSTTMQGAP